MGNNALRLDLSNPEHVKFLAERRDRNSGKTLLELARDTPSADTIALHKEDAEKRSRATQEQSTELPEASYNRNRNKRCVRHGLKFDSIWEADCWDELLLMQAAGYIIKLERQKKFIFEVNKIRITHYRADFWFTTKDGKVHVADAKNPHNVRAQRWSMLKRCMRAWYGIHVIEFINKDYRDKNSVSTDVKKIVYELVEQ